MRAFSRPKQWDVVVVLSLVLSSCTGKSDENSAGNKQPVVDTADQDLKRHHDSKPHEPKHDHTECTFASLLSGIHEVPARLTPAVAVAVVKSSKHELAYELNVTYIRNVVAAHIHLGAPGQNGPVVAFLAGPFAPGGGPLIGQLARGTLSEHDLTGPLAGRPLSELVAALKAGEAYVNVHTNDGVAPANSGPGDFQDGEIRGQLYLLHCKRKPHGKPHHHEHEGHDGRDDHEDPEHDGHHDDGHSDAGSDDGHSDAGTDDGHSDAGSDDGYDDGHGDDGSDGSYDDGHGDDGSDDGWVDDPPKDEPPSDGESCTTGSQEPSADQSYDPAT